MVPTFDTSPWSAVGGEVPLELPQMLHAQLFLLAYDRFRGRLDGNDRWRFGLALRTAMLTDLYLTVAGRPADERPLAIGLIGALGQLPTVLGFDEAARHSSELEDLVDRANPPITGMRKVIDAVHSAIQANDTGPYST
jgi:hypothetical protein